MKLPYYLGDPELRRTQGVAKLPTSSRDRLNAPEGYLADTALAHAVNVAITLGRPLLVTGDPGVGKTQLAASVAAEFGLGKPLTFETKSTSTARDLFYSYDTLGRFHAAHTGQGSQKGKDYLSYSALGRAILLTRNRKDVEELLTKDFDHNGPRRSVVLIDEVDKAPRDFPNDILNELDLLFFKIPELGNIKIEADNKLPPILIITSNSERHLPDAFLRRCVYYNIPFPDTERLQKIVVSRLAEFVNSDSPLLKEAFEVFLMLRDPANGLDKKPATAELLDWLLYLHLHGVKSKDSLRQNRDTALSGLFVLVKNKENQEQAEKLMIGWLQAEKP